MVSLQDAIHVNRTVIPTIFQSMTLTYIGFENRVPDSFVWELMWQPYIYQRRKQILLVNPRGTTPTKLSATGTRTPLRTSKP
jgi:hypothetical protein